MKLINKSETCHASMRNWNTNSECGGITP